MKIAVVKNILIKQSVIIAAVLTVLGGILWYIMYLSDDNDEKIRYLESQVNNVTRQAMDLAVDYGKVTSAMDEYLAVKEKQAKKMLEVDKVVLRDVLADVRNKYNVDISEVKAGEVKPVSGDKYKRDTVFIEASDINLKFNSLTDIDIFNLIEELSKAFSGVKVTSFKFSSVKELDATSLSAIKTTGFTAMVSGELKFTLFGLRNVVTDGDSLIDSGDKLPQGAIPKNIIPNRIH